MKEPEGREPGSLSKALRELAYATDSLMPLRKPEDCLCRTEMPKLRHLQGKHVCCGVCGKNWDIGADGRVLAERA